MTIPYNTKWIRDLVPGVTWDNNTQSIKMPDGSVLDKSLYTISDSKAYVRPEDVSKWIKPTTPQTPPAPAVKQEAPAGSQWIRNLDPGLSWDKNTGITLSNGQVVDPSMITLVDGKSYVNPNVLANYFLPKAPTAEEYQNYIDQAREIYQPSIDNTYERINSLVKILQDKLAANIETINSQGNIARSNLQSQETADSQRLRNQAIARGTYTSGVADYQQQQMAGDYAGQYRNLEGEINSAIAGANADMAAPLAELANQASIVEDSFLDKIMTLVSQLSKDATETQNNRYQHIIGTAADINATNQTAFENALARTEMWGRVMTEADAKLLNMPVGTPYGQVSSGPSISGPTLSPEEQEAADLEAQDARYENMLSRFYKGTYRPYDLTVAAKALTTTHGNEQAAINYIKANREDLEVTGANINTVIAILSSVRTGTGSYDPNKKKEEVGTEEKTSPDISNLRNRGGKKYT